LEIRSITVRHAATAAALLLGASGTTLAGTLASGALVAPLSPGQDSRLVLALPPGFRADQQVWLVYDLVALAPGDDDSGELGLEQSFERVMTSISSLYVTFRAEDMDSDASAGTIAQRLEEVAGRREPQDLKKLMGADLHAAYEAVNAGTGRILVGRRRSTLPPPGKSDEPLVISVTRATGMQPLALRVTAGQGELPLEFQEKAEDSIFYKLGYLAGLACFGWLVLRFFRRKPAS
jgi:hypothetical protein